jgi:hypothetical protein
VCQTTSSVSYYITSGTMRTILSIALIWGLFISGFAQVADNVQEATRYRVNQDNITTLVDNQQSYISEVPQSELKFLENRSTSQLEELGGKYGWVRSASQLEELGGQYGWVRSTSQLEELGGKYGWVRSASQLEELGGQYGWVR